MNQLRVAVVTHAPFPRGNVSTMRYTSYLKSLQKLGVFTFVLIYCPTRMASDVKERSGIYNGISYQYATNPSWKNYNLLNKIIFLIKGLFNSIKYLNKNEISTIILYGDNPFIVHLFFWIYTLFTGKKFIGDRSELPSLEERNSKTKLFLYGVKQRMFDGMIIMTKQLLSFYSQYSKKSNFLFFLPMTIDPERFNGVHKRKLKCPYIAVVFGTHNRDGLEESLMSFDLYCKKGGRYHLKLIGDYANMPNKEVLDNIIHDSMYCSRIHILGKQPNNILPEILINAEILMTTPNSYISGGFPTKLGEYMLSGVPIVVTKVGELLDYISPDVDMLMNKPGDIDGISNSLLKLEVDNDLATNLSVNAELKAKKVFCADSYAQSLKSFLLGISEY